MPPTNAQREIVCGNPDDRKAGAGQTFRQKFRLLPKTFITCLLAIYRQGTYIILKCVVLDAASLPRRRVQYLTRERGTRPDRRSGKMGCSMSLGINSAADDACDQCKGCKQCDLSGAVACNKMPAASTCDGTTASPADRSSPQATGMAAATEAQQADANQAEEGETLSELSWKRRCTPTNLEEHSWKKNQEGGTKKGMDTLEETSWKARRGAFGTIPAADASGPDTSVSTSVNIFAGLSSSQPMGEGEDAIRISDTSGW